MNGTATFNWLPPRIRGPFMSTDPVYDVFVAMNTYDFQAELSSGSVPELIESFETGGDSLEHFQVEGTTGVVFSGVAGERYTILVTAKVDGVYSSNTTPRQFKLSGQDPRMRETVSLVGLFLPTRNVQVQLEPLENGFDSLTFMGAVAEEAQNLIAGDHVHGFTSNRQPFIVEVIEVIETSVSMVELRVGRAQLSDIFDEIDVYGFSPLTRDYSSTYGRNSRGLFFSDIGDAIVDGVSEIGDAGEDLIGDATEAIEGLAEGVVGFLRGLAQGELSDSFTLVDIQDSFNFEVFPGANFVGDVFVGASLEVSIGISLEGVTASAAVVVDYNAGAGLAFQYAFESQTGTLAERSIYAGETKSKIFYISGVPVEINWTPNVDGEIEINTATVEVGGEIGMTVQGSASIGASLDTGANSVLQGTLEGPTLNTDYSAVPLEGEAMFEATGAIIFSTEVGVYGTLLTMTPAISFAVVVGASSSVQVESVGDVTNVDSGALSANFNLDLVVSIPFAAEALDGEYTVVDTSLFETSTPIIEAGV